MKKSLKTKPLEIDIVNRWRWEVVAPVSSVRIGETNKEQVKSKQKLTIYVLSLCMSEKIGTTVKSGLTPIIHVW